MMIRATLALFAMAGLTTARPACADFLQNTFGLDHPAHTITFDEVVLPQDTPLGDAYAAQGITFSLNMVYDEFGGMFSSGYPNISGHYVANPPRADEGFMGPVDLIFSSPQHEAAFGLITSGSRVHMFGSVIWAMLGNTPQEMVGVLTDHTSPDNFYGFTNITFDRIRIWPGGYDGFMAIDNIQFGTDPACAPEPCNLALLAMGGLPLAGVARRRRCAALRRARE
jgi:hypothetical protein